MLISLGSASEEGIALVGKNYDWFRLTKEPGPLPGEKLVILFDHRDGHKYLGVNEGGTSVNPGISEKGIITNGATRHGYVNNNIDKSLKQSLYWKTGDVLKKANTAREAVRIAEKVWKEGGMSIFGGGSVTYADQNEAWIIESTDSKEEHYEIIGPKRDMVFAHANFILSNKLKRWEKGNGKGHRRAERGLELLNKRYGSVTAPYMFRILRDRLTPIDHTWSYNDQNICNHGYYQATRFSGVGVVAKTHVHLLSKLWLCIGPPSTSPFIPFYIGITEIPPAWARSEAYQIFEELDTCVANNPNYEKKVLTHWEAFEYQIQKEIQVLEEEVKKMIRKHKQPKAHEILTKFVKKKCTQALSDAKLIIKKINEASLAPVEINELE